MYSNIIILLDAFTSAMKSHGKVGPLGIHQKPPEYEEVFSQFDDTWSVSENIYDQVGRFVYALCMANGG